MKSVMISIQPYWVFLIIAKTMGWNIDKEKTVEVRKTFPKDKSWDKVVKIYCSKDKKSFAKIPKQYQSLMEQLSGKVIGEFKCNEITKYPYEIKHDGEHLMPYGELEKTCLDGIELYNYLGTNDGYGWHISDLVIYDEPKELSDFVTICPEWEKEYFDTKCLSCKCYFSNYSDMRHECTVEGEKPLERPPQSWCYVEGAEGE